MRRVLVLLLIPMLAGCASSDDRQPDGDDGEIVEKASSLALVEGGKVVMDVPVPVLLIGFDNQTATQLQDRLTPMNLRSSGALAPTAVFEVLQPTAPWQAAFDDALPNMTRPAMAESGFSGIVYDGNAIEAYLQSSGGLDIPPTLTALVIMDAGTRGHAYHYAGDVGWREPVRTFGEHSNMLFWDPFAAPDPWVGAGSLHQPVQLASPEHLANWVERATAIRALQMPIWPTATTLCHAVTVILAVRNTSQTSNLGLQSWQEALDIPRLQSTFENLTGDPVHFDLVVLQLPVDDPPLEAITRENSARAITQTYLDMNFEDYHVAHEGCEPYLSLVVYGDLVDQRTQSNGNAIMMTSGKRISTSLVAENVRFMSEVIGYNQQWDESTAFEGVGPGADPLEWFNWVVSHETGHLFSLPHPNYSTGEASYSDAAFASTWNVMGYQMRRIVTETSVVDANNFARNQAAYATLEATGNAQRLALEAMGRYEWKEATRLVNA